MNEPTHCPDGHPIESITDGYCHKCNGSAAPTCSLDGVVREFIRLLDIEEESDSGRRFRPNGITSCRAMDGAKMVELLREMKRLTENVQVLTSDEGGL